MSRGAARVLQGVWGAVRPLSACARPGHGTRAVAAGWQAVLCALQGPCSRGWRRCICASAGSLGRVWALVCAVSWCLGAGACAPGACHGRRRGSAARNSSTQTGGGCCRPLPGCLRRQRPPMPQAALGAGQMGPGAGMGAAAGCGQRAGDAAGAGKAGPSWGSTRGSGRGRQPGAQAPHTGCRRRWDCIQAAAAVV